MDDNTTNGSSLSADIGIGLKASLEIKAEVPKEDTGRLVTALTDIIRPFTETRGLRADQIRLQREDVLLEIAKKARTRAALENIELHPVPTKMLVPFLEKASLEDLDGEMQEHWAALLLSASKEYQATHLTFIDIMSRMSSSELKLLEEICFSYKAFPETSYPGGHLEQNQKTLESNAKMLVIKDGLDNQAVIGLDHIIAKEAYDKFVESCVLTHGGIMHAGVSSYIRTGSGTREEGGRPAGLYMFYNESAGTPRFRSLQILERERLVNIERIKISDIGIEIGYFNVTYFGIEFVRGCSPQASKMVADRKPKPSQQLP
jgi:Abortive infection alpha